MYKVGQIVTGDVFVVKKTSFLVRINADWIGLVHIRDLSDYYVNNINSIIEKGNNLHFVVMEVNKKLKRLRLSFKQINAAFLKNPFIYELKETKQGYNNLKQMVDKEIEND